MAALFTNAELQAQLRLSSVDATTATQLATLASDIVRDELNQLVDYVANDQITLYGDGGDLIVLPERPVVSVSAVLLNGQAVGQFSVINGALQRIVYAGSQYAGSSSMRWPYGVPVAITYTHGYQTVPGTIKSVALELAAAAYTVNDTVDDATFIRSSMRLSAEQCTRLDPYRFLNI